LEVGAGDFFAGRTGSGIELAAHVQTRVGCRGSDQFDDDFVADQGPPRQQNVIA
jgi:hypothetical protein